ALPCFSTQTPHLRQYTLAPGTVSTTTRRHFGQRYSTSSSRITAPRSHSVHYLRTTAAAADGTPSTVSSAWQSPYRLRSCRSAASAGRPPLRADRQPRPAETLAGCRPHRG